MSGERGHGGAAGTGRQGVRFALKLAWRELRGSARRIGLYMGAVALGVAALVAIDSLRANVLGAVRGEARELMGADLRVSSSAPLAEPVRALVDSLAAHGAGVATVTRLPSMVLAPTTGAVRLLQVQAVTGAYPFYGTRTTEPAGLWPLPAGERRALVDPAVLVQLGVGVGDTVLVGESRFAIAGTVTERVGEVGLQSAVGPRIYIPGEYLGETGLVRMGSLVEYQTYIAFAGDPERFRREHEELFREERVRVQTAQGQVERLVRTVGSLGSYLSLVGLAALLLGGVAVASAVNLFVEERLTAVAVLRCLGAGAGSIFGAYLLQTGVLGLAGAAVGVGGGLAAQWLLPRVLEGVLPVGVEFAVHWPSVALGLGVGVWVAVAFALPPLLRVRGVAPLRALRRDAGERDDGGVDWPRVAAQAMIGGSVVALGVLQAPGWREGVLFAVGIGVVLGLLYLLARLLVGVTRRHFPRRAGYTVRQGVSNLFRPQNQTLAVTLALGFGVFLIGVIFLAQHSILDRFRIDAAAGRPNLLFFDLQTDQRAGVEGLLARRGVALEAVTPLVPGRIAAIGGRGVTELLGLPEGEGPSRWALRREYRNTYRDTVAATERVVAGEWWSTVDDDAPGAMLGTAARPARISLEVDLARELGVGVGDRITWDFQGVELETVVANLREVDWAQFAPNFFVVFEPGVLESAPQTLVALARVEDAGARAELQRELVLEFPNVSVLDLTAVQGAVDGILGKVGVAVRSLALFAVGVGVLVLIGALRATRVHRLREAALLRTLGASRRQVEGILLAEYLALGGLAGLAGVLFAGVAAWPLVTQLFGLEYRPPIVELLGAWVGVALAAAVVGVLNGRAATERTPLEVLREG